MQKVFNYLTAETESDSYAPLLVAPLNLADRLVALIDREAAHAEGGKTRGDYCEDEWPN